MKKRFNIHIGLRTLKTAAAVIIAMLIVESFGATTSKLIFAMLGAMAAVQPTFKESVESCLTQIVGVLFGAVAGVLLLLLPIPSLAAAGIGIILVITLYNMLHIRFSPSLPCFIVVMLCTGEDPQPITYALGRIWDTAIGLGVGMLVNTLIFPYDNSQKIRSTVLSLDKELIAFLEDMFDGDDHFPDTKSTEATIDTMYRQLRIFSSQLLLRRLRRQKEEIAIFEACQGKARALAAQMEVLCRMEQPGRLNEENRQALADCGAVIGDQQPPEPLEVRDIVTNYHVTQLLSLRQELLDALKK